MQQGILKHKIILKASHLAMILGHETTFAVLFTFFILSGGKNLKE